jgi:hypothetical protein
MDTLLPLLPGLLLLLGQVLVAAAHIMSDRQATSRAADLLAHPVATPRTEP